MSLVLTQSHYPSRQITISSKLSGLDVTKGVAVLALDEVVTIPNAYSMYVSVESASIPITFYNVSTNNNLLVFGINGVQVSFTIPVGNYDACALAACIRVSFGGMHICAEYDAFANSMRLLGTDPFSIYPTGTLNAALGFSTSAVTVSSLVGGTAPLTSSYINSTYAVDLSATRTLSIRTNFQTGNMDSVNALSGFLLATIPVESEFGGIQVYKNSAGFRSQTIEKTLSIVTIRMTDDIGNLIDFRNANWSITLQFDFVFTNREDRYVDGTLDELINNIDYPVEQVPLPSSR